MATDPSSSSDSDAAGYGDENPEKRESSPEDRRNNLQPVQSRIEHFKSKPREWIFIAIICMAQLMTQAALGQAIAPLHIIGTYFGLENPGQLSE